MIKEKRYGNIKKSLMYSMRLNKKGLIEHIEFRGLDGKKLFNGAVDTDKHPLKFSAIKKDKVFEYLIFLKYYPAMVEKNFRKVSTKDLPIYLRKLEITNPALVNSVLKIRRERDKKNRSKKLSRKR